MLFNWSLSNSFTHKTYIKLRTWVEFGWEVSEIAQIQYLMISLITAKKLDAILNCEKAYKG